MRIADFVKKVPFDEEMKYNWFTEHLKKIILSPGINLAYFLLWENYGSDYAHFYFPYKGQPEESLRLAPRSLE